MFALQRQRSLHVDTWCQDEFPAVLEQAHADCLRGEAAEARLSRLASLPGYGMARRL